MNRHELRESIFKIVFQIPFYGAENMQEQTEVDIESLKLLAEEPLSEEDKIKLSEKNEQYIKDKVQGIVSHIKELDEKITEAAKNWELERLGKAELAILRLASYEIIYDEDIPRAVAINEAVELAKEYIDIAMKHNSSEIVMDNARSVKFLIYVSEKTLDFDYIYKEMQWLDKKAKESKSYKECFEKLQSVMESYASLLKSDGNRFLSAGEALIQEDESVLK